MGKPIHKENHTKTHLTYIVRVTKYRYYVLKGDIQKRGRELVIQREVHGISC